MSGTGRPPLGSSLLSGLLLLVAVAVGARVVYNLLAPLVPFLIALITVGLLARMFFRR